MIYPLSNFRGDSTGEDYMWELFQRELPSNYISFHGYRASLRKPDIILLVPDKGVLVIEIKGIYAKSIAKVPDNNLILRYNKPQITSPLKQADNCMKALINEVLSPAGVDNVMFQPTVAYPYITENEYYEKHLDKISIREITFLKEDLVDFRTINYRISIIFDLAYQQINVPAIAKGGFNLVLMDQVANLISPDYKNEQTITPTLPANKTKTNTNLLDQSDYSILVWDRSGDKFSADYINSLVQLWLCGTKLYLFTGNENKYSQLIERFSAAIAQNDLPPEVFTIKDSKSFRLELGTVPLQLDLERDQVEIHNGEVPTEDQTTLQALDLYSSFNYGQYKMEHAPCVDVKVTAGAGTGKTHTMVSRICYLIWKHHVDPVDLSNFLIMVTFTNKAADEMKGRLFDFFLHYYQLTKQPVYFDYLEAVEDIQISTIHSLCRMLISRYGTKVGLGTDFIITTGTNRRREILREEMDKWLADNPNGQQITKMKLYYLQKRLEEFIDKIDNKNIDLVKNRAMLDFGSGVHCLPDSLIDVIVNTQRRLDEELTENNSVSLKSIIRKLGELCDRLSVNDFPENRSIRYLFVDEFQDTDNVQIDLIQRFQALAHFNWFVVGDTKQCIYRFRGADDEAFARLTKDHPCFTVALKKNYRTDQHLLEEMNHCFVAWDKKGNITYTDEDVLSSMKNYSENAFEIISYDQNIDENTLVHCIQSAIDHAKQVEKGQAAVLVRNNYQIESILDLCRRHQIAIGSEVGGRLFQSDPTIDLYKLLQALKYQQEPEYLFNLYTTSYICRPLIKMDLLGKTRDELVEYFNTHCGISNWTQIKKDITCLPVVQVLQTIVESTHPWDRFAELMNNPSRIDKYKNYYMRNLDQVFEKLIQIGNTDFLTINKLLDYLEIMIATRQEVDERETFEELDAEEKIICTTVHKAKGMEFDTVILPFCRDNITNTIEKGNVDVIYNHPYVAYRIADRQEESQEKGYKTLAFYNNLYETIKRDENISREREETRILYVAMTRAKRRLVCLIPKAPKNNTTTWGTLIQEGLE